MGYERMVGALANLGHRVSDQTVGKVLKRHGIATDLCTEEVLTLKGLVTYYVLFFIQRETQRVCLAGIMPYPDQPWMEQRRET